MQPVGNHQMTEQNADGGIQGNGGWGLGSVITGAAGLVLSGLQSVKGVDLSGDCDLLIKIHSDEDLWKQYEKDGGSFRKILNGCSGKLLSSVKEGGAQAKCYSKIFSRGYFDFGTNLHDIFNKCDSAIDPTISGSAVVSGNLVDTSPSIAALQTTVSSILPTKPGLSSGEWSSQGDGNFPWEWFLIGLVNVGLLFLLGYTAFKKHCKDDKGEEQGKELQEVLVGGGDSGNGKNEQPDIVQSSVGDDKKPSVRESLLKGNSGDRPKVGPGGKHKEKAKSLSLSR